MSYIPSYYVARKLASVTGRKCRRDDEDKRRRLFQALQGTAWDSTGQSKAFPGSLTAISSWKGIIVIHSALARTYKGHLYEFLSTRSFAVETKIVLVLQSNPFRPRAGARTNFFYLLRSVLSERGFLCNLVLLSARPFSLYIVFAGTALLHVVFESEWAPSAGKATAMVNILSTCTSILLPRAQPCVGSEMITMHDADYEKQPLF